MLLPWEADTDSASRGTPVASRRPAAIGALWVVLIILDRDASRFGLPMWVRAAMVSVFSGRVTSLVVDAPMSTPILQQHSLWHTVPSHSPHMLVAAQEHSHPVFEQASSLAVVFSGF